MKTNCKQLKKRIPDFLDGTMDPGEKREFEEQIKTCPEVADELASFLKLESDLRLIGDAEVPFSVETKFNRMLEEEKAQLVKDPPSDSFKFWHVAAAIALLLIGFLSGRYAATGNADAALTGLKDDIKDMKQLVMLSMIENQSASKRIRAVSYTEEMATPAPEVISSLIKALKTDESPNVRLAAAAALRRFSGNNVVRAELVKSMELQTEPILQIALINILVEIEEKNAIKQLQYWINSDEVSEVVKKQAKIGIEILI